MAPIFSSFPDKPDHNHLELEILELWERESTFEKLRELNRGGPRFSFVDGPITANNPMGVHHAWGRTLKDVFQRYKALRGFDQRYQNGFDCQGLWVEVEVESALGLNSKRDIEEYGLAEFAERCKERVAKFSEVITEQSRRLGMWMDWDADYYTFTDTNIEYIWRFLKAVHEREWLYQGHRSTVWCPRCGTSISQHELFAGEYRELEHPSLYVRFPLKGREGEALAVWTTTPWTLPANVAAAVNPIADYGLRESGEWVATALHPDESFVRSALGAELVGLEYEGPFDHLPAQQGVVHRVIPWDDVALDEGTGIVHIAPGAGAEDFELSRVHDLPVLAPLDEAGRMLPGLRLRRAVVGRGRGARSSTISDIAACSSTRDGSSTATRRAGAAARRSSSASSTTGSSRPRRSGSRCSTRTRRSSGRRPSTRSAWTTGCATWATGTSRASATSGCRCRSTRATTAGR